MLDKQQQQPEKVNINKETTLQIHTLTLIFQKKNQKLKTKMDR